MKKTKFDVILNLWISFVINVILSIVLPILAIGFLTPMIFLKGFIIAFIVSTAFVFIVPIVKWSNNFAALFKVRPHTLPSQLISTILLALCLGTLMSLLMTAVNAGAGPYFFAAWLSFYPLALLTVYVSAQIGIWTGIHLAKKICHIPKGPQPTAAAADPAQAQNQDPEQ